MEGLAHMMKHLLEWLHELLPLFMLRFNHAVHFAPEHSGLTGIEWRAGSMLPLVTTARKSLFAITTSLLTTLDSLTRVVSVCHYVEWDFPHVCSVQSS